MAFVDTSKLIEARTTFSQAFNRGLSGTVATSVRALLCNEISSTGATQKYPIMGGLRGLAEWTGERVYEDIARYAAQIDNKRFAENIELPLDEMDDDQYGGYATAFEQLGQEAGLWGENLSSLALRSGETSACYDGASFFSASHKIDPKDPAATTYANLFTGTALNATNFDVVYNAMSTIKGRNGNYMPWGRRIVLVVPPQLETTAKTIVAASQNANGSTNVIAGKAEVFKLQSLAAAPLDWYMAEVGWAVRPMAFQTRMAPTLRAPKGTEEYIVEKLVLRWNADARGNALPVCPWLMAKAKG